MEILVNKNLNISEDDVNNETNLEQLFKWKHSLKKEINKMSGKLQISGEKKEERDNSRMKRALECQKLLLEIVEDRITIIK
jgi:hypothetical protein